MIRLKIVVLQKVYKMIFAGNGGIQMATDRIAAVRRRFIRIYTAISMVCMLCVAVMSYAQRGGVQRELPPELMPKHPAGKEAQRANIDAKRAIENMYGEDALPRSREFKRTESRLHEMQSKEYINKTIKKIL